MYTKEFYHTKEDAHEAAVAALNGNGFINDGECTASGFYYISRDALEDDRDGICNAFLAFSEDGTIIGVFAYAE